MKVRGHRILVDYPVKVETTLQLTPEVQEQLAKADTKRWEKLKVFAVGDAVDDIMVGDEVTVSLTGLEMASKLSIEDQDKLLIDAHHISIVWSKKYN